MSITLPTNDPNHMALIVDRRHPDYDNRVHHWKFCQDTYDGGREWFEQHMHRYIKEGDKEFRDRQKRGYRFNHTREVVNLITKYIFKEGVIRNEDDAPKPLIEFWKNATLTGAPIDTLMEQVSSQTSIAGRAWVIVDNNVTATQDTTIADTAAEKSRIYAYVVRQEDVLDFARDENGVLLWILYRFLYRNANDPTNIGVQPTVRYMLWTTDQWFTLEEQFKGQGRAQKRVIVLVGEGINPLNVVPAHPADHYDNDDIYAPPGLVDEIVYLDRAVANYLSNLDAIIQDQTFSQLIMPAQGIADGDDEHKKLMEMGTKRIFTYDSEGGTSPSYISPDATQAGMIMTVIKTIIGEIYHSVGMAGERTKQDNAMGIDNSSGVAKAYDFDRMNALLVTKAKQLARTENEIAKLVCMWADVTEPADDNELVHYPNSYDVRGLPDEFEIAQDLTLLQAPDSLRRQQMTTIVNKLLPACPEDIMAKIITELKDWPIDPVQQAVETATLTANALGVKGTLGSKTPVGAPATPPAAPTVKAPLPSTPSKQGQAGTKAKTLTPNK